MNHGGPDRTPSYYAQAAAQAAAAALAAQTVVAEAGTASWTDATATMAFTAASAPENPIPAATGWTYIDVRIGQETLGALTIDPAGNWTSHSPILASDAGGPPTLNAPFLVIQLHTNRITNIYYGTWTSIA